MNPETALNTLQALQKTLLNDENQKKYYDYKSQTEYSCQEISDSMVLTIHALRRVNKQDNFNSVLFFNTLQNSNPLYYRVAINLFNNKDNLDSNKRELEIFTPFLQLIGKEVAAPEALATDPKPKNKC